MKSQQQQRQRTVTVGREEGRRNHSTSTWRIVDSKKKKENYLYPWSGPIPVVSVEGSPYEMGKEHGAKCRERIPKTVEDTWQGLVQFLGCKKSDIVGDLKIYSEKIYECHPSFTKEMEGVADGAKVSYDDIVLLNSQINILHERGGMKGLEGLLCSSFVSWGNSTRSGMTIMGHNDDGMRFTDQFLILLDAKPDQGHRFATPIIPGYLGYHTVVNDSGLCAVGNALENGPLAKDVRKSAPMWTFFRYIAQFIDDVDGAVDYIENVDSGIAGSFLFGDKSGGAALIHLTPNAVEVIRPKEGSDDYLAMTNHALVSGIKKHLMLRKNPSNTHYRYQSLTRAIKSRLGNMDASDAMEIMSTHYDPTVNRENHPSRNTPCRHYEFESKFAGTCRSAVVEMGEKLLRMYVALGNPCSATWVELDMKYDKKKRNGESAA